VTDLLISGGVALVVFYADCLSKGGTG